MPGTPRAVPDVQFSRIRFLGCTRFRTGRESCLLFPAVRLACSIPALHVRCKFPLRATYSRRVLPHVVGFPHLRVLRSIRLPNGIKRAFLFTVILRPPYPLSIPRLRFRYCPVSGFPLTCLNNHIPYPGTSSGLELMGPPKFLDASLPACHGLRTPADLPTLAYCRVILYCLR